MFFHKKGDKVNKEGISPLIWIVFLVAIVIAIVLPIIIPYATNQIKNVQEKQEQFNLEHYEENKELYVCTKEVCNEVDKKILSNIKIELINNSNISNIDIVCKKECLEFREKTREEKLLTLDCNGINKEIKLLKSKGSFSFSSEYYYNLILLSRMLGCEF